MFPYPVLTLMLLIMWLLLNEFSFGHLVLGSVVAIFASWTMASLRPSKPQLRKWYLLPKLFAIVMVDVMRSNLAVSWVILRGRTSGRHSSFLNLPVDIDDPTALAVLAIIITATPGSAWLEYDSHQRSVLIHVFDLADGDEWRDLIKNRYEKLLLEIFS
jgi:multicomponent K+:H+ antiporter subunit E